MRATNVDHEGRLRIIRISMNMLSEWINFGSPKHITDQPKDLKVLAVRQDWDEHMRGYFSLKVYSKEYSPVPEGELIPAIDVVMKEGDK